MMKNECIRQLESQLNTVRMNVQRYDITKKIIMVFGAGNTSKLYNKSFETEKINVEAFLDNDSQKIGRKFLGKPVLSPETIKNRDDVLVLICSDQPASYRAISRQLQELGIDYIGIQEFVASFRYQEFLSCASLLDDEESVKVYTGALIRRLTGTDISFDYFSMNPYFCIPPTMRINPKEVFVDCGAFVGDTLEQYLWSHIGTFSKIYAFEPDKRNFAALQERIKRLNREWALQEENIILVHAGVGSETSRQEVCRDFGLGAMLTVPAEKMNADNAVKVYALDDFFNDKRIDFLKADIESYEFDMLRGAEQVIRRDRPRLAICIYHNISDMYQILLWLHHLNIDYKFAIRHHSVSYSETVLYAYSE